MNPFSHETPGKVRSNSNNPGYIIAIVLLVTLSPFIIGKAQKYYTTVAREFKEAAKTEEQERAIAEAEAEKQAAIEAERQKHLAAKMQERKQKKIQDNEVLKKQPPPPNRIGTRAKQGFTVPVPAETTTAGEIPTITPVGKEITVSVREHGFFPVEFVGPAMHAPLNVQLLKKRPDGIKKDAEYRGYAQWYGVMELGNRKDRKFNFVLDLQDTEKFVLYFDANNNKDLTDDGEPLHNSGSGSGGFDGFATTVLIPWQVLIENSPYTANFNVWFFCNEAGWMKGQKVSHYSRTQLEQTVRINGNEYRTLLIDTGYNDADLTNDGIIIDLNRNGDFDPNERPATEHVIDGKTYKFKIVW